MVEGAADLRMAKLMVVHLGGWGQFDSLNGPADTSSIFTLCMQSVPNRQVHYPWPLVGAGYV